MTIYRIGMGIGTIRVRSGKPIVTALREKNFLRVDLVEEDGIAVAMWKVAFPLCGSLQLRAGLPRQPLVPQ